MKNMQKGFTLIELMIVVAIIAILAAIAIPAYQDYLIRSQVSEGAVLSDGAKTALAEFYSNKGHFPLNNTSAGLASPVSIIGKYVTKIDASATVGQIQASYGNKANSAITASVLVFSATPNGGSISWTCSNAATTIAQKYLPTSCRTGN
jgi:type IV pilus assembly protein PilA